MLWEGLVEIKCRYTLRESGDFGQLAWMCLVDDKYCLSRNHRHFFQVQMQLFAANKLFVLRVYLQNKGQIFFPKKTILAMS